MSKKKPLNIAQRVIDMAAAKGMSITALAKAANISQGGLSTAKNGTGKLNLETLQAVAPILGVSVGELLGEASAAPVDAHYRRIPLDRLLYSELNERNYEECDASGFSDLADDIADRGLLHNLVVYPSTSTLDTHYCVIAGQRRLAALKLLEAQARGLPADLAMNGIPCRVFPDDVQALEVTIVENMQREDVHFLDRAQAFARLRDKRGYKAPQIAKLIRYDERMVQQYLQIHDKLPEAQKAAARRGELSFSQARELVQEQRVKATEEPPPLLAAIGHVEPAAPAKTEPGSGLSPTTTAKPQPAPVPPAKSAKKIQPSPKRTDPDVDALEREIEAGLGLRCLISGSEHLGWQLSLVIGDLDQFDHILGLLLPNRRG